MSNATALASVCMFASDRMWDLSAAGAVAFSGDPRVFRPGLNHEIWFQSADDVAGTILGFLGFETRNVVVVDTGLTPTKAIELLPGSEDPCPIALQEVKCETAEVIAPGRRIQVKVSVAVSGALAPGIYETEAQASGGGGQTVSAISPTSVQPDPVPFGILPGFIAPLTEEDGTPATQAGSHPYQQTTAFSFPHPRTGR